MVFGSGFVLAKLAAHEAWQVLGLGLMLPGGGFLAYADFSGRAGVLHLGMAALAGVAFVMSLFVWFATGNAVAPPAIWLLAALLAVSMRHGHINPDAIWQLTGLVTLATACIALLALLQRSRSGTLRNKANIYLAGEARETAGRFQLPALSAVHLSESRKPPELSLQDLKLMRFVLDRALQPVPEFEGFEWIDQFQTAAVRYQLNFMGYALSMAQSVHLSALGGYFHEAQRRLIEKQQDHRVWRYWALENLWGNLRSDPDPTARENIMYSGFCATQIAMFHAASGRRDYELPGSMVLRHPSSITYRKDLPALIDALVREYHTAPYYLIACEPNWVYPLCNTIGAAAIKAHDAQCGKHLWTKHETRFRQHLENEFISLSGRIVPCRSTYTGVALPMIGGAMPQAMPSFFMNATLPDIALRQWLLLRRELLDTQGRLRLRGFWPIDTGNYRFSRAGALAATALAAVEMGDEDVATQCLAVLEAQHPFVDELDQGRACFRPSASVWAHAVELMARSGAKDGFRHLIENPRPASSLRPILSQVAYPDVLVAQAVSDETRFAAILYPGSAAGTQTLGLSGLRPGQVYQCSGTHETRIVADAQGCSSLKVLLAGRAEILVRHSV